jgi:hypothetical protein
MARYRSLWLPGLLILVGAVALAVNLGLLQSASLYRLADLWPVLLVLLGAELILRSAAAPRVATAAGLALLLVAVAGAAGYVALAPPLPAGNQTLDRSAPVGNVTRPSLSLSFSGAEVNVHGEPLGDLLYRAHLRYSGSAPQLTFDPGTGELDIAASPGLQFLFAPRGSRSLDLALNDSLPWSLDVSGGASSATFDISTVALAEVSVSGGANHVTLDLGKPTGTVSIDVSGGASTVSIRRPAGVAARVQASGGANSVRLDNQHLASFGDATAQTAGFAAATDRYDIDVSGGASNVSVTAAAG